MSTVEVSNELVKVVEESGLEQQTALTLKESFLPFFEQAEEWRQKAQTLVVTDVSQTHEMKMARQARLALKEIRVNADKTRKMLKEDSLRYGKAVQGVYNVIEYLIVPIEKHLEEQEKFAEKQEEKRKAELKEQRESEVQPYSEFIPFGVDLGSMADADYAKLLNGAKLQLQAKVEEEKRLERERIERERIEAENQRKLQLANNRMSVLIQCGYMYEGNDLGEISDNDFKKLVEQKKAEVAKAEKERAERERQLEEERAKAEAERKALEEKARKEREERERIEAEIKAKQEAEEKARKEAEAKAAAELKAQKEAERKAKAAPDKAKLEEYAISILALAPPQVKSEEAKAIVNDVQILLNKVVTFINDKSSKL